ncbi:MAG: hypothetical protein ABGW75_10660 [Pirellulales bacterium]|jgi:hypothetical protein
MKTNSSHDPQEDIPKGDADVSKNTPNGRHIEEVRFPSISEKQVIEFLKISTEEPSESHLDECLAWIKSSHSYDRPIILELYGTLVIWTPAQMVLVTAPRHFKKAEHAVLDFTTTVFELGAIEQELPSAWEHYENDIPNGFSFYDPGRESAAALAQRYKQTMSLAGRLSRLSPHIHLAPEHPPTLAGQLGERLRDRSRLVDREEFASEQIDTILRLYETAGQRVSEHALAQREYVLIWMIVFLLTAEIILLLVDLLSTAGN